MNRDGVGTKPGLVADPDPDLGRSRDRTPALAGPGVGLDMTPARRDVVAKTDDMEMIK